MFDAGNDARGSALTLRIHTMDQYSISIFGNIEMNRPEAEISFKPNSSSR